MVTYNTAEVKSILTDITKSNLAGDVWSWLTTESNIANTLAFNTAFALMPRKTGKAVITSSPQQRQQLQASRPGITLDGWTADRLGRTWLLVHFTTPDETQYFQAIEKLFAVAEMNELVALYGALPLLPYPELWVKRCAEGIRSNIGTVLEAVMYNNPYPTEHLNESAWNQMVLKAFFTEKQINRLYGLDTRANQELARILIDYAKERHAASRSVDAALWHLAGKFVTPLELAEMKQGKFPN